jgi:hypothetical protein
LMLLLLLLLLLVVVVMSVLEGPSGGRQGCTPEGRALVPSPAPVRWREATTMTMRCPWVVLLGEVPSAPTIAPRAWSVDAGQATEACISIGTVGRGSP